MFGAHQSSVLKDVVEMFTALSKSQDGLTLFDTQSFSSKEGGNFQILPCTKDESNQVNLSLFGSYFQGISSEKNFFFFSWKSEEIRLFYAGRKMTLDQEIYSQIREAVKQKLGNHVKDLVDNLEM